MFSNYNTKKLKTAMNPANPDMANKKIKKLEVHPEHNLSKNIKGL